MSALTRVRAQVLDRLGYLRGVFECWGERYARRLVCHLLGKDMQVPPCPDIPLRPTEVPCYNWLRRDAPRGCKYRKQLECLQGETVKIRAGTISFHTGQGQHGLFRDQTGCIISKGGKCQDTVQTRPQGSLNCLLGILRIIRLVVIQKTHFLFERA